MKTYLQEAVVMAREDGKGLRLLFPVSSEGELAKAYFDRENHREDLIEKIKELTEKAVELETGQLTKEEEKKDQILDLSKIKMPVTIE